jgi:outer membrane receptor protein involved in Fe transport
MRKFLLFTSLATVLFILPAYTFSQNKSDDHRMKLSGTVSDSSKPVALVTVRLFKKNNGAPLQTTLSKDNGNFQLNKPDTGNYILSFTHTGFAEKKIPVTVSSQAGDIQIDPVQLSKTSGLLKEVVVTAQRPLIEQSDDKIVFNAEDDPASKTETAIDILRRTPFITVDGEDNIKINGKSNFKVLLNGRETSMFARNVKEALRGFPGALISKIEVITSPSAKYDGEGIGGLINIITKKKVIGYNGTLSSFARTSDKVYNYALNGNAKFGKVGISVFVNKGYRDPISVFSSSITIPTVPTAYSKRALDGYSRNSSGWAFGNAELSWEIDTLNTVSLYTNIDSWSNKSISNQTITTDFVSSPSVTSYYDLNNKANNPGVNIGSDYIKKFRKNKDREFSLRFLGEFGKQDSRLISFQDNSSIDRYLINNSFAKNDQYTIQADNVIPVKKNGRFEGGVKAILRKANSDFQSLVKYNEASTYSKNPSNTDYFKYNQNVYSAYSMYTIRFKKSNIRFGARLEYTDVNGNFVTSNTKVKSSYATLLPNIQYTNKLSKITTLVLGYTKRLQRPYIWDLNPFVYNNDSLNISYGNPDLDPQTTHAVNTQLRFTKGNTFAGINLEGSYSGNRIMQYSSFDPATGITTTTSLNIGKEFQSSLNVNFNTRITPKWNLFVNGSIRYLKVTNNSDRSQSNSGFGFDMGMNTSYRFNDKFNISSFFGLFQQPRSIQTTYPLNPWHNVAFNYKIFKNKVNISLRAVNVYEKNRYFKTIIEDKNFYSVNINSQPRRAAVLALTWNFGKLTENVSRKKGVTNDDILTKPAAPTTN